MIYTFEITIDPPKPVLHEQYYAVKRWFSVSTFVLPVEAGSESESMAEINVEEQDAIIGVMLGKVVLLGSKDGNRILEISLWCD